jgi:hypothetical protein
MDLLGGGLFFMIKQKIIRGKMRYSNLSNNMMISELRTTITIQIQSKQDFAVVKQVDGRAAHMTDTTRHQSWQSTPPPLPAHAGSIPGLNQIETEVFNSLTIPAAFVRTMQ